MSSEYKRTKFYSKDFVDNHNCEWKTDNPRFKDLTGLSKGEMTILKMYKRVSPHNFWFAECSCGNIQTITSNKWATYGENLKCSVCAFNAMSEKCKTNLNIRKAKLEKLSPSVDIIDHYNNSTTKPWLLWCKTCNTAIKAKVKNFTYRKVNCKCSKAYTGWTQSQRNEQINHICADRGLKFLGWKDFYNNTRSRIFLKCPKHKHYESSVGNLVTAFAEYGCPYCADETKNSDKFLGIQTFLENAKKVHGNKFDYSEYEYIDSRTPSRIICKDCNLPFNASYDNHVNKARGCPHEKGKSAVHTYIISIEDKGTPVALKYGKATLWEDRFKTHVKNNPDYKLKLVGVWSYQDTDFCNTSERLVKQFIGKGFLSRKDFPKGFTETSCTSKLEDIIRIFEDCKGVRIK